MILLRWLLGIGCALGLALFALILLVGKGFEGFRSGAGSDNASQAALTIGVPAMLLAMLVTVAGFGGKGLLHATAVAAVLAIAAIGWAVIRTNPGEGCLYAGFLALYLLFYALRVR